MANVLELQLQSFQWIFRTDFLWDYLVWSPCSPWDSQESSLIPYFKTLKKYDVNYKFFGRRIFSSLQFSRSVASDSLWPHESQHARPPCPSPTCRACLNSHPSSQWCYPTISSSVTPSPPALNVSQHQGHFQWAGSSHQGAKVLELQLQSFQWIFRVDFLQDWLVWSPCSPRDSQESSPIPQFKSINSTALTFLHDPTLTFIHDYWENHSFDYIDLCHQSNISAF